MTPEQLIGAEFWDSGRLWVVRDAEGDHVWYQPAGAQRLTDRAQLLRARRETVEVLWKGFASLPAPEKARARA